MAVNNYDKGRLNLPFVGIPTFAKKPYVANWEKISADIAIIGAPFDSGTQYRSGARFGPRGVREGSTLFSFGHAGAYDHEDDAVYLDESVRIVDLGDADIVETKDGTKILVKNTDGKDNIGWSNALKMGVGIRTLK